MNDPGLDQPVQDASHEIEQKTSEREQEKEEVEEDNYLDPSRWWFASTAIPMIAGTFGPMANAFSICALVESWREETPPGAGEDGGTSIKDPAWLIGVNAVSLGFALIANFALLLNMARRLSFAVAQSLTIVGFFLAAFMLIGLISVANSDLFRIKPDTEHTLSQAWYYAIQAAALYCIISLLMIITVIGAYRGHYERDFRLTISQRTLMLQTIAFMVYLLIGALIFSNIEGWKYLDAVYWADFTLLTVGIGSDFSPKTTVGRGLLFPFAIFGIVTIGLVIGSVRSLVLERGKRKLTARFTEKRRESTLRSVNKKKRTVRIGWFRKYVYEKDGLSEAQRRKQEFEVMRIVQTNASRTRRSMSTFISLGAALCLWFIGALVFKTAEWAQNWTYFDALYFSYTSLLTIGYGDLYPSSNAGKPFFVFWSLLAVPTLTILISNMGDTVIKSFSDFTIWAGSLTILPGEEGLTASFKAAIRRISKSLGSLKEKDFLFDQAPGFIPHSSEAEDEEKWKEQLREHAVSRITSMVEDQELGLAQDAEDEGDLEARDMHLYHYILSRELRHLMGDISISPPKQYTYAAWTYYLLLLGQDETNPDLHRRPRAEVDWTPPFAASKEPINGPGLGQGMGRTQSGKNDMKWSWLGVRSPLMGHKTESEWLVEQLSLTLERELLNLGKRGYESGEKRVPASMIELLKLCRKNNAPRGDRSSSRSSDGDINAEDVEGAKEKKKEQ